MRLSRSAAALLGVASFLPAQDIPSPESFFGFAIGTDGEAAPYPKVLEYFEQVAAGSDRVRYEVIGETTMGNPYALLRISSAGNLGQLQKYVAINQQLADPRGLSPEAAETLIQNGKPIYFLYATIHSTEVGNGQAIVEIVHELATSEEPRIVEMLENSIVLLVPSQNPDGQVLLIDHYYKNRGTRNSTGYPDLYHKYVGHDNNRDWFLFTQIETRLNVQRVQNVYKPQITHDMHQMGPNGFRMFVPPFIDPYDPNFHPILSQGQAQVGMAMASALVAEGREGVGFFNQFDLWTPARQYMVYHGQPRILTEIASANFVQPLVSADGQPLGPQERRWNFPRPYTRSDWRLRDIVDYGKTAVFAGIEHVAKYRETWMRNFYRVHRDWVERDEAPYAFVIPRRQRDPLATYELLEVLEIGAVEIDRATEEFQAGGRSFESGSWIVQTAQPYGAFAKTMLEKQVYPDLRYYPGGPPIPPYDVTAHTLGYLLGVEVVQIDEPLQIEATERVKEVAPVEPIAVTAVEGVHLIEPHSNAVFRAIPALHQAGVPVYRAGESFADGRRTYPPGTLMVPASESSQEVLSRIAPATGLEVDSLAGDLPAIGAHLLRTPTRIGLWRGANNMPGGWLMWLFEQYGFQHEVVTSQHFEQSLDEHFDAIVLPPGIDRRTIIRGLDRRFHGKEWSWAYGVGSGGWDRLTEWVRKGGTIVALGDSVETVRDMFDLPITPVLPQRSRRGADAGDPAPADLRATFQSPASLLQALDEKVVEGRARFFCPGSLLYNEFDPSHPLAYGMPERWPVFFRHAQAYALSPGFGGGTTVAARYPAEGEILASGWLLGEDLLRDRGNVFHFPVGEGHVIAIATQATFRTQTRATFKLLFNAMYHGPAEAVAPEELQRRLTEDGR